MEWLRGADSRADGRCLHLGRRDSRLDPGYCGYATGRGHDHNRREQSVSKRIPMRIPDTTRIHQALMDHNRQLLETYDPEHAIRFFDAVPSHKDYWYLPEALRELWSAVHARFSETGFGAFQKITMLRLVERFELRAVGKRYTSSIRDRFAQSFTRIIASIEDPAFSKYQSDND